MNEEKKKCIVAHPQMQHSMKVAFALKEEGILQSYQTMLYYGKNAYVNRIYCALSKNGSVLRFINRCKDSGLDASDVITHTILGGLILELLARLDKTGKIYYSYYVWITGIFAKKVARNAIKENARLVIMYDYTAKKCFEYLKKRQPSIVKVLDMSSLPSMTIDQIISNEEKAGYGALFTLKRRRYSKKRCAYYSNEIELADYFLTPSRSVTDALLLLGVDKERIIQVPFGVDLQSFTNKDKVYCQNSKVHFLFVGRMEAAKGICYLIDAFDRLAKKRTDFILDLVGAACGNEEYIKKEYVNYHGVVAKQEMIKIYKNADVFVFPSLWEGCSLSLMEAMASGLPVIATGRSGVKEFLHDNDGGFCIGESNSEQIYHYANWYLDHAEQIPMMGKNAADSIQKYSWENYFKTVSLSVKEILNEKGEIRK